MADEQNNPKNQSQEPHSDFEVFRVPPREMMDKYTSAPKDLEQVNPTGGTDQSKKHDFGLGETDLFKAPANDELSTPAPTAIPVAQTTSAQKPVVSNNQSVNEPKSFNAGAQKLEPIDPDEAEVKDIFSEPINPPSPPQNVGTALESNDELDKLPPKPKNLKWLWILLIVLVLVVPIIFIALEWFGLFNIGLSKIIGSPPSKLAWSRANIDFENFNAAVNGKIDLEQTLLTAEMKAWVNEGKYDQKEHVDFSGSVIKTNNALSGAWAFANDQAINFRIEGKKLYLQRPNGKWYQIEVGVNNIDAYFKTIQNYFSTPSNFKAIKPTGSGVFSYKSTILPENLKTEKYTTAGAHIIIDLNNKNFSVKRINLVAMPLSGINLEFNLGDFSNETVELQTLDKKSVLDGTKEFPTVYSLFNLLTGNGQSSETAAKVDVDQTDQEKNDIKRKTDLKKIADLLTQYKVDHNNYPVAATMIKIEAEQDFINKLTPYLEVGGTWGMTDPEWPNRYYGYISADGSTYRLSAVLQATDDPEAPLDPISNLHLYIITDKTITAEN